jgi:hypothetical protein
LQEIKALYILKFAVKTVNMDAASWSSFDYVKVYKQEAASVTSPTAQALGVAINEDYGSSWSSNANLIETFNVTQGNPGDGSNRYISDRWNKVCIRCL